MNDDILEDVCSMMQTTGRPIDGDAVQLASSLSSIELAKIGVMALIDEATGYQGVRPPDALTNAAKRKLEVRHD